MRDTKEYIEICKGELEQAILWTSVYVDRERVLAVVGTKPLMKCIRIAMRTNLNTTTLWATLSKMMSLIDIFNQIVLLLTIGIAHHKKILCVCVCVKVYTFLYLAFMQPHSLADRLLIE